MLYNSTLDPRSESSIPPLNPTNASIQWFLCRRIRSGGDEQNIHLLGYSTPSFAEW
jgi:hypothetical protein